MNTLNEPGEEILAENPSAAYEQIAAEIALHARTWTEEHETSILLNCECGFSIAIEDMDEVPEELTGHRAEQISRIVNGMLATAWDNGWLEGSEGNFPTMAGILLNPYRQIKADFDLNRSV